MNKRILILATTGGFLNQFEMGNVRILEQLGYEIHYASNTYDQHYIFDQKKILDRGIQIHHVDIARSPYMFQNNWNAFWQLVEIVKKYHIQVIHCHTPVGGVLGRLVGRYCKREKLRVIYTAHGFHFFKGAPLINNSIYYVVEKLLARWTDRLVLINQEDYENALKFHMKKGGKVYHIPGVGLDMKAFTPLSKEEREEKRKALGLKKDDFFLVSVGELNENKNQEVVLKALLRLRKKNKNLENIRYGICGDGFFWDRIREDVRKWKLQGTVTMYGYCTHVREILGCADAMAFPSKREGLGMAALEALAVGIPVIASDNRGTREYMRSGENGIVCQWNDIEGFAGAIEQLRSMNQMQKQQMKQACIQSVTHFQQKYTDEIMEQVYKSLEPEMRGNYEKNNHRN